MISYQLTSTVIGLAIATVIVILVRRNHLHGLFALWWLGIAAITILLGLFPRLVDYLARLLGISYPPVLALLLGFALLLLKVLTLDLYRSRQERRLRNLAQRLAILEARQGLAQPSADADERPTPERSPASASRRS
ncbi:MAG TPA: DUF2304 domain-containing protein [Candidatus Competibacteraceae bacterium]|nr:DUF2304 domain-containing protein [Candidatus Competibacteraceae bacterium]